VHECYTGLIYSKRRNNWDFYSNYWGINDCVYALLFYCFRFVVNGGISKFSLSIISELKIAFVHHRYIIVENIEHTF